MKLHLWEAVEYDKVIYLDADMLVVRNIDHLFDLKATFAACPSYAQAIDRKTHKVVSGGYSDKLFNAGFLVIEPCHSVFGDLWSQKDHFINPQDPSDQGLLNMHFSGTWHRLPSCYNATRRVFMTAPNEWKELEKDLAVIHYTIEKPWVTKVPKCEPIEKLWWECYTS
jgi:glycogenin glucosyltransferase